MDSSCTAARVWWSIGFIAFSAFPTLGFFTKVADEVWPFARPWERTKDAKHAVPSRE